MKPKFTSTIAGASIFITVFTLFGRSIGFIREIIFAAFFGLSENFELYLVATILPTTINGVIIVLAQNYFVPNYFKYDKQNKEIFFNQSLNFFFFSGFLLALVLFLFSNQIIDFYANANSLEAKDTAITIFQLFLLTIPLSAVVSVYFAYLQVEKNFIYPVISNLFINIFIIFAVPFLSSDFGVYIIPISFLLGLLTQTLYLFIKVKRKIKPEISFSFFKSGFRTTLGTFFFLTLLIEIIGQMFVIVDRFFLDKVQQGGIAALNYSATLFQLPIVILPFAITTVLFPSFSELIQRNNTAELKDKVDKSISLLVFLTVPISAVFIFYGDFIIEVLFERRNFSSSGTIITYQTFKFYSISLVFYTVYSIVNKLIYSANFLKQLLLMTIGGLIAKIFLSIIMVKNMQQDGLALSTSVIYISFCLISMYFIKKLKINSFNSFLKYLVFYSLNGLTCLIIVNVFANQLMLKKEIWFSLLEVFNFITLFLFTCYIINDKSLELLSSALRGIKSNLVENKGSILLSCFLLFNL